MINVDTDCKEIAYRSVDRINLAHDRDEWRAVNTA